MRRAAKEKAKKSDQEKVFAEKDDKDSNVSQNTSPSSQSSNASYWQVPGSVVDRSISSNNGLDETLPPSSTDGSATRGRMRSRTTVNIMRTFAGLQSSSPRPDVLKTFGASVDDMSVGTAKSSAEGEVDRPSIYLPKGIENDIHEVKYVVKKG